MPRILLVALFLCIATFGARADEVSSADRAQFQAIISDQIQAFRADDGARAYGFAAPTIHQIFPTVDVFMEMVKRGYKPVYRPQQFSFGEAGTDPLGRPVQHVTIVGPDGLTYEALYTMERQADGTWRILGCTLLQRPGVNA
jgi:uncharacterized protein DUF4864